MVQMKNQDQQPKIKINHNNLMIVMRKALMISIKKKIHCKVEISIKKEGKVVTILTQLK